MTGGSSFLFELLLPLDASGTDIAGVSPTELRFSEQRVSLTGAFVPEPSTGCLLGGGLTLLAGLRRRGRR